MALDDVSLAAALRGHLRCERDPAGGWRLWRHSPEQVAVLDSNPMWGMRVRCPAGIRLVIETSSPWVELDFAVEAQARPWAAIDCWRDGARSRFSGEPADDAVWAVRCAIPGGRGPAVLWLPHTQAGRLLDLRVAPGAAWVPSTARRSRRLLALGDSITQGLVAAGPSGGWAMQLAGLLDAELVNQGVGGHVFDHASLDRDHLPEADLITVAYGTNDWAQGVTAAALGASARAYLAVLRSAMGSTPIALITPIWRSDHERDRGCSFTATRAAIAEAGSEIAGVTVIDGWPLVPQDRGMVPDGVHPDETGMTHYARGVHAVLRDAGLA